MFSDVWYHSLQSEKYTEDGSAARLKYAFPVRSILSSATTVIIYSEGPPSLPICGIKTVAVAFCTYVKYNACFIDFPVPVR